MDALDSAVRSFLAAQPPVDATVDAINRLRAAKYLEGVGDRQQAALAAAAIALAGHWQALATGPAAQGTESKQALLWAVQAARDAWQAVQSPEVYRLWAKEHLRAHLEPLLRTAIERAESTDEAILQNDPRTGTLLRELAESAEASRTGLEEAAARLRVRIQPLLDAARRARQQNEARRKFDALLDATGTAPGGEIGARLGKFTALAAAEPWLLTERGERLAETLAIWFGPSAPAVRETSPQPETALRFAGIVAARLSKDAAMPLQLARYALELAWAARRRFSEPQRRELASIVRLADDAATRATAAPESSPAALLASGAIASIRLQMATGPWRLAAAETGADRFRRAYPNGCGGLPPEQTSLQRACLQCLLTARHFAEAEQALRAWLQQPGLAPSTARAYWLKLAELKLSRIVAMGRDTDASEANGLKSIFRKAAAFSSPEADPAASQLAHADDAIIHLELARMHEALGEWPDTERQARFFLAAAPAAPHARPSQRRARAHASVLLGRSLAAQERGGEAPEAYRAALAEYWTPDTLAELLRLLHAQGAAKDWADAFTREPPRGAGGDDRLLLAHIDGALRQSADLQSALLACAEAWLRRSFAASALRRALPPDHPFLAALRTALRAHHRNLSDEARLLAGHLAALRSYGGAGGADDEPAWPPAAAEHFSRELVAQLRVALESTIEAVLWEYTGDALAALASNDTGALERLVRCERWATQVPPGYKHLDSFDLNDRLQRWQPELDAGLRARHPGWSFARIVGDPCWIRGATWLELRAELRHLLGPGTSVMDALLDATAAGGAACLQTRERELALQIELSEPAPAAVRQQFDAAVARWIQNAAEGRKPEARWRADGAFWELTLKLAGSAQRETALPLRETEKQCERLLAGRHLDIETLADTFTAWQATVSATESDALVRRLPRWARDFAAMRTRIWLAEDHAQDLLRHPRLLLQHFLEARLHGGKPEIYEILLQRFRRRCPGPMGSLDMTTAAREAIALRRESAATLRYRMELEPECRVRAQTAIVTWVLQELCAEAEKTARQAAANAEITVRLWTEQRQAKLEISYPRSRKDGQGQEENRFETLAWVAQLHRGECQAAATQRNAQATFSLPLSIDAPGSAHDGIGEP